MNPLVQSLQKHDLLSAEDAQRCIDASLARSRVSLAAVPLFFLAGLAIGMGHTPLDSSLIVVKLVAVACVIGAALSILAWTGWHMHAVDCAQAGEETLAQFAPMLEDDAEVRALVREWERQRPLQMRDVRALVCARHQWEAARSRTAFRAVLDRPDAT